MDDFRKMQKRDCVDAGGGGKFGCSCCRRYANLNKFKKYSRSRAKNGFNEATKKEIRNELITV